MEFSPPVSDNRPVHTGLEGRIADIIMEPLEGQGYELVRVQVIGTDTPTVQIMADRADGASFTLGDCEAVSRLVSAVTDVEDPISTAWTLEVSSAGIDRPLTRTKDFIRYAGFDAKIELNFPGPGGRKRFTGKLAETDSEIVRLRMEKDEVIELKRADIRKAKLVLTDALIAFTTTEAGTEAASSEAPLPDITQPQESH
jgi:ribosome maturation factor RimP